MNNNLNELRNSIFSEGCTKVELDFSNPVHTAYFLEKYGGEELLKKEFPLVYEAFLYTKQLHEDKKLAADVAEESNNSEYGMKDEIFYINGLIYDPKTDVFTGLNSYLKNQQVSMLVSGGIKDVTRGLILDSCYEIYDQPYQDNCNTELKYPSINLVYQEDTEIISEADYTLIRKPADNGTKCTLAHNALKEYARIKILGGTSLVESFAIQDPKTEKQGNILILYNREPGSDEDTKYYYKDVNKDSDNMVEVNIPIKGAMKFNANVTDAQYSTQSQTTDILIEFSDNGSITFNYTADQIKEFFKFDSATHTLSFELPRDWNTKLNTADLGTSTVLTLRCSFYLDVTYGEDINIVGCSINSVSALGPDEEYYTSKKPSVRIPKITVRWGCFGKDTKITMADGIEKPISEIKIGDSVMSDKKESLKVKNIISGQEKMMVYVETDSKEKLLLSESHPMVTSRGMVTAKDLNAGDLLLQADGNETSIATLYLKEYNDTVYNLKFDDQPKIIIANGLQAGDWEAQCAPNLAAEREILPETPEEIALREEFHKLHEKMKQIS